MLRLVPPVGVLYALLAALAFSTLGIWGKLAATLQLNTGTLLPWRFGLAAALLLPFAGRLAWRERGRLLAVGALYAVATHAYFAALGRISAGTTSLLLYLAPAFVVLFSWLLGVRPSAARLGALALTVAGLVVVAGRPGAADRDPLGLLLGVATGALYGAYLLGSERWLRGFRPLAGAAYMSLASALYFAALGLWQGRLSVPQGAAQWGVVTAMTLLPTLVAVPALCAALARLGAARTSVLATTEPLWTLLLAALVLRDPLRPAQLLGGGLILAGALLAQRPERPAVVGEPLPPLDERAADDLPDPAPARLP